MTAYIPQPGDIGLVAIEGGAGWAIRIGQWLNGDGYSDYEHAFVYVGDGRIVEAEPGGARTAPVGEYAPRPVLWLRCPPPCGAAVAAAALEAVGTPYSWLDYAALAAHRLRLPVPGLRRFVSSSHHEICSQLADAAANQGGWHLFTGVWPGYVTPGRLAELAHQQDREGIAA